MEFQSNLPIYLQLMDDIKRQIVSGKLQPGEKLPSVRDLAMEYGVNPNTMQKALSELEWEKLLYTMRTAGRYVTEDGELIEKLKEEQASKKMKELIHALEPLGFGPEEMKDLLGKCYEEMKKSDTTGTV